MLLAMRHVKTTTLPGAWLMLKSDKRSVGVAVLH
jgi:hypothetical protein